MNNIIETITCNCGTVFQWQAESEEFGNYFKPKRCQPCLDKIKTERDAREAKAAQERELYRLERIENNKVAIAEKIDKAMPELFRRTDINSPRFNATAWARVKAHELSHDVPWIGFVGMTGRCKTRMAYLYAEQLLKGMTGIHMPSFAFVASYEIGDAVGRQYGNDFQEKSKAREFLDNLRTVDVLLVDDLGKGRLTPAVASELHALIDHRHAHLLWTIWTANSTPEEIAAGLSDDMAGPFAGRIIESSKIYTFR